MRVCSSLSSSTIESDVGPWIFSNAACIVESLMILRFSSLIFLNMQLNLFFTLFSVLPGSYLMISDHLLPICWRSYRIFRSSSGVNGSRLISGFKKLYHLSRHCFPLRLTPSFALSKSAISCHYFVPLSDMILRSISSSRFYHYVLVMFDLWFWFHLY